MTFNEILISRDHLFTMDGKALLLNLLMLHGAFISSLFRNILHPIWHLQLYISVVGDLPQIESGFCSIGPMKKVIAIVGVPR